MPRRARQLAESGYYHVMFRGVNRDAIFLEDVDRVRFLDVLMIVKQATGLQVLAYCLMTNHVHLVLGVRGAPIGDCMKRLGVRYAGWFNRKYGRVGHLFQDRFGSRPVDDDPYLITVVRYVWRNPVEAGLVADPADYEWSSCHPMRPAGLVDDAGLDDLLPSLARADLGDPLLPLTRRRKPGPQHRHSAAQASLLLYRACGTQTPADFRALKPDGQLSAVRELRTRSVSYDLIAEVTGLSATTVRRMQASELAGSPPV